MESFFSQVFTLLTTPPGNLVYRIILAFSVFGALQMSAQQWQDAHNRPARRMATGLWVLLGLQLLLFISAGLGWQDILDTHKILPVMAWGASLLSILWLVWLWSFPTTVRSADAGLGIVSLLLIILTVFGILWWSGQNPLLLFNGSQVDQVAGLVGIGLSLVGIILLIIRRPVLWGYGLASMVILFLGCLIHWLLPLQGSDYAGMVRLAEMGIYPLLLALPQRLETVKERVEKITEVSSGKLVQQYKETDSKLLKAFLSLAGETNLSKFYQGIARTYSQLMVADICLVALPPDASDQIVIAVGYDLIMDRLIDSFAVDVSKTPMLTNVLRRGRNLRLQANTTSLDLKSIAEALNVKQAGHLLAVAVSPKGSSPLLSIILISPYSNRVWSAQDQQYLIDTTLPLNGILQRVRLFAEQQQKLEEMRASSEKATAQSEKAQAVMEGSPGNNELLQKQFEQERDRAASLAGLVTGLEAKVAELEAKASVSTNSATADRLKEELHLALDEVAELRAELSSGERLKALIPLPDSGNNGANEQSEVMASIAQELRRPVSSIIGYTDLLLGESVGLLGAMQRKFLERVKASTERMGGLLDELINVTSMEGNGKSLNPTVVDLNTVIDEALAAVIANLSERNIALRVDLSDDIPQLRADRDALLQILTNLLQNASIVTPVDGEIWLRTRLEVKENEPGYVLLQVTDSGGGIPPEALPRVFSRLYRSDNQSIQGVGDKGVGLAIVKTLVGAHGGRIWVDSEIGRGATYSVLLPLAEDSLEQEQDGGLGV